MKETDLYLQKNEAHADNCDGDNLKTLKRMSVLAENHSRSPIDRSAEYCNCFNSVTLSGPGRKFVVSTSARRICIQPA